MGRNGATRARLRAAGCAILSVIAVGLEAQEQTLEEYVRYDEKCIAEAVLACAGNPPVPSQVASAPLRPHPRNYVPGCYDAAYPDTGAYYVGGEISCIERPAALGKYLRDCKEWLSFKPPAHCERRLLTAEGMRNAMANETLRLTANLAELCKAAGGTPQACDKAAGGMRLDDGEPQLPGTSTPATIPSATRGAR